MTEESEHVSYTNLNLQELSIFIESDNDGKFTFKSIPYGNYHITIIHDGYLKKLLKVNLTANDLNIDIVLEKRLIETPTIVVTGSFTPVDQSWKFEIQRSPCYFFLI